MARPGIFDLAVYRGDTYRWLFRLWNDPDKTDPTDLTGVAVKAEIRDKPMGTKTIALLGTELILPNQIRVNLDSDTSKTLPNKGAWDLQLTYPGGDVVTIIAGGVAVTPDVTELDAPGWPVKWLTTSLKIGWST